MLKYRAYAINLSSGYREIEADQILRAGVYADSLFTPRTTIGVVVMALAVGLIFRVQTAVHHFCSIYFHS